MAKNGKNSTLARNVSDYQLQREAMELANSVTPVEAKSMVKSNGNGKKKQELAPGEVSKLKMGLSDLGGTVVAQGFNEGWSWLMRMAGRWSVDGFVAKQNDYLQSLGPSMVGLIWYLIELYNLGKNPTPFKLGRLEAAKLIGNLGMSKFFQALRSRSAEAKEALDSARAEAAQYLADNKTQAANLERLQTQLAELQKQQKQAGGGSR